MKKMKGERLLRGIKKTEEVPRITGCPEKCYL
jgi:hypothetical protein